MRRQPKATEGNVPHWLPLANRDEPSKRTVAVTRKRSRRLTLVRPKKERSSASSTEKKGSAKPASGTPPCPSRLVLSDSAKKEPYSPRKCSPENPPVMSKFVSYRAKSRSYFA